MTRDGRLSEDESEPYNNVEQGSVARKKKKRKKANLSRKEIGH